jgi:hypothetical protein
VKPEGFTPHLRRSRRGPVAERSLALTITVVAVVPAAAVFATAEAEIDVDVNVDIQTEETSLDVRLNLHAALLGRVG